MKKEKNQNILQKKCQLQEAQKRENILYDRIERDYLVDKVIIKR